MRRSRHAATLFQYLKNLQEAAVMTDVPLRTERCDQYIFLCTTSIPFINLRVCCEAIQTSLNLLIIYLYYPRVLFNPCSLSSVTANSSITGGWRGHVLRGLPPWVLASITACVFNSRMP